MKTLKKYLKFVIGIAAVLLVLVVFACTIKSADSLEMSNLNDWKRASLERRTATVQMVVATDTDTETLVKCVDKMATLDDADKMMIRDAISLCYTGVKLKENL